MNEDKVKQALLVLQDGKRTSIQAASFAEELLIESLAPEPRFYKNQAVLVSDNDANWFNRRLTGLDLENGSGYVYRTEDCGYKYCKPDPDAASLPNWIEHDTDKVICVEKENCDIAWVRNDGKRGSCQNIAHLGKDIVRYAIIPLPEYLP